MDDGCGNALDCGSCAAGQSCTAGVCETTSPPTTTSCTPKTCAQLGATCGQAPDGCGGMVQCGSCAEGEHCGGGGQPNVCGAAECVEKTCAQLGASCGAASDGCGGVLQCGSCGANQQCSKNACVAAAPATVPGSTRWWKDVAQTAWRLELDAAGYLYTSENKDVEYGVPPGVFAKLSPDGARLAESAAYWRPQGYDVSPLGNLFMVLNTCYDAPTGECTSLHKLTVGGATAWKQDLPFVLSGVAVDTHGSAWIGHVPGGGGTEPRVRKYAWDGAVAIDRPVHARGSFWLATDSADAVIVAARGDGKNVLEGNAATLVGEGVMFIMKLDAAGNFVWMRRLEVGYFDLHALDTTAAGTVVFKGLVKGTFEWSGAHAVPSDEDYLFVLEANGTPRFAKSLTDAHAHPASLLAVDKNGRALIAAYETDARKTHLFSYNLDGTVRWQRDFNGALVHAAAVSPDRSVVLSGTYDGTVDFGLGAKTAPKQEAGFLMRLNE